MMIRKISALAALLTLTAGASFAGDAAVPATEAAAPVGLAIGAELPMANATLQNVDGKATTIDGEKGPNGTLVVFTCNACPWVKAWESRIAELGNAYEKRGVGVIAINSNDPAKSAEDGFDEMKKRAKKLGLKFAYTVDATSDVARAFGATRTPEAFLFDKDGKLVYHGTIDDNSREPSKVSQRYLKDALEAVSTGNEVPVAETKSLGCSIKFRSKA